MKVKPLLIQRRWTLSPEGEVITIAYCSGIGEIGIATGEWL